MDDQDSRDLRYLRLHVRCGDEALVSEILSGMEWDESAAPLSAVSWRLIEEDAALLDVYLPDDEDGEALRERVLEVLRSAEPALPDRCRLERGRLPAQNWQEAWKRYFNVERVTRRLYVVPSWMTREPLSGELQISIDPGMIFGTGKHATTRGCLRFLERLSRAGLAGSFLDLGCGSGILAVAALKLGFGAVHAMDIHADVLEQVGHTCELNHESGNVVVECADLLTWSPPWTADVVAANILAPVLLAGADVIAGSVRPGGRLLLAGMLGSQYEDVAQCFRARGFVEEERYDDGEWSSARLRHEASRA